MKGTGRAYEIRNVQLGRGATPDTLATVFRVIGRDTQIENWMTVSISRETLRDWGYKWPEETQRPDREVATMLTHMGLHAIQGSLRKAREIPRNLDITTEIYGAARPLLVKECIWQESRGKGVYCKAAANHDPWSGVTNDLLCGECQMPSRLLLCSELKEVRTCWFPEGTRAGVRRVVEAECTGSGDPRMVENCIPGLQDCWVQKIQIS